MIRTGTEYPAPDSRPYVGPLQWVQYQLDTCSRVEEVIATETQLRIIQPIALEGHFFISDRMGTCAIIEFIDGEMVYHINETAPVKVLTNSMYEESLVFLYEHEGWGGDLPIPQGEDSLDRFARAADMLQDYDQETPVVDHAFDTLENVAQSESRVTPTYLSIVYDTKNLRIYFQTLDNEQLRYFDLSAFDFSCRAQVKVLDVNAELAGDVSSNFIDYTYEINRGLIERTNMFNIPDEALDIRAHYPETMECTECFIATAVYGSSLQSQVDILRKFRDRCLLKSTVGKSFVNYG